MFKSELVFSEFVLNFQKEIKSKTHINDEAGIFKPDRYKSFNKFVYFVKIFIELLGFEMKEFSEKDMKLRKKKFCLRALKNMKGQVAIFVVLIFQVLFILFAMSINIALTAYDKINMQNSLDLAAYYGAKKQAEVLNAMAHINYQMRQNWKLLAWRYRILGTLTQYKGEVHSLYSPRYPSSKNYWCPQNHCGDTRNLSFQRACNDNCKNTTRRECQSVQQTFNNVGVYGDNYCDNFYFVCISHEVWKRGIKGRDQNLCTTFEVDVPPVTDLQIVAGFMAEAHLAARGVVSLQEDVAKSCPAEGALNWLMTQLFMTHFRLDQKDRKVMIKEIYERTLKIGEDLDGEKIVEGAQKVFCRNLSRTNCESAKNLCQYSSSSGRGKCEPHSSHSGLTAFNSFEEKEFEEVFDKLDVRPVLQFLYDSTKNESCTTKIGVHYNDEPLINYYGGDVFANVVQILGTAPSHSLVGFLTPEVGKLFWYNQVTGTDPNDSHPMKTLTLSFFKKPNQTLYYALRLEYDYESQYQIFSLNLSEPIKFKASAIAKPFGSNFGPQPDQNDPLIPIDHPEAQIRIPSNKANPALLQPNFSRYPGDKWGLIDKSLHDNSSEMNFLNKHKFYPNTQRVYSMEDYFHLTLYNSIEKDPLAKRGESYDPLNFSRVMEMMAVYPDFYDISYYSILGNYHQTYFKKICKLLKGSACDPKGENGFSSRFSAPVQAYIRGDFGWPDTDFYIEENHKNKGVELSIAPAFLEGRIQEPLITKIADRSGGNPAKLFGKNTLAKDNNYYHSQRNLFYPWLANPLPDRLLSSWTNTTKPNRYKEYSFPEDTFLECEGPALKGMPVPSACASGGRSGYSVKLISCEIAKDLEPQPSDIDDFCPN